MFIVMRPWEWAGIYGFLGKRVPDGIASLLTITRPWRARTWAMESLRLVGGEAVMATNLGGPAPVWTVFFGRKSRGLPNIDLGDGGP
jgi:hypothetical protein